MVLEILDHIKLLFDNLLEESTFDCECTILDELFAVVGNQGFKAHPKRDPRDNLKYHTSQTPSVYYPRVVIVFEEVQQPRSVLLLVFIKYVVENLWSHILRGGHGELAKIAERKGAPVINQFNLLYLLSERIKLH